MNKTHRVKLNHLTNNYVVVFEISTARGKYGA